MTKNNTELLQSLAMLFQTCEPLTYDCLRSPEEYELLINDIQNHTYYCSHVINALEKGDKPKSWDEWNSGNSYNITLDTIDLRGFGDDLTNIFTQDRKEK